MKTYTVDSVALIHYLLDILPEQALAVVEEAEAGNARLEVPAIVLVETSYILQKRDEVRGIDVRDISEQEDIEGVLATIERGSPIELVETGYDEVRGVAGQMASFSIHDAMIVASHESRNTDAVLTKDGTIADSNVPTVWD
ncbi:PIN domain-containing protein [Halorussus lipolyticus]|uniref:PIN domain-containing protein n=1 Tax=Halorussus lipolyticus TaxID=3034024 RepID=UPI0023E7D491|nr:PIN domain-containing protein [Halorussus sp. DT80]